MGIFSRRHFLKSGSFLGAAALIFPKANLNSFDFREQKNLIKPNSMAREIDIREGIDWTTVWLYAALVFFGWLNIYAAVYNPENPITIFSTSHNAGKQLLFITSTFVLILIILFVDNTYQFLLGLFEFIDFGG